MSCHGGDGVCIHNGAVAVNETGSWAIYNDRLYVFSRSEKAKMMANTTLFDIAERNWRLWNPKDTVFNTDAFWPFKDKDGESTCRSCGFESGSSEANKIARNRKFYLGRSGAVTGLSPHIAAPYPDSVRMWHSAHTGSSKASEDDSKLLRAGDFSSSSSFNLTNLA